MKKRVYRNENGEPICVEYEESREEIEAEADRQDYYDDLDNE